MNYERFKRWVTIGSGVLILSVGQPGFSQVVSEAVILHGNNSSDHGSTWQGLLASLGLEYDNVPNEYVVNGMLLDANGNLRHRLFICKGGYASYHQGELGQAGANGKTGFQNLRDFIKAGGSYTGSCSGSWLATQQDNDGSYSGAGLFGMNADASLGSAPASYTHGSIANCSQFNMALDPSHPISSVNVEKPSDAYFGADDEVLQLNACGGKVWPDVDLATQPAYWGTRIKIIGKVRDYTYNDQNKENMCEIVEYAPQAGEPGFDTFGRMVYQGDHPEHNVRSYWFTREVLKYLMWGAQKSDPSGNHPPHARMSLDKNVVWGTEPVTGTALGVLDPDGDPTQVFWDINAGDSPIVWEHTGDNHSFSYSNSTSKITRVRMRVVDDGSSSLDKTTRRICERTQLVASNVGSDPDNQLVEYVLTANPASGAAPLFVQFLADKIGGDNINTSTNYGEVRWDAGNGVDQDWGSGTTSWSYDAVYFAPGVYTASLAVRDDDGHWNVETVEVQVGTVLEPPVANAGEDIVIQDDSSGDCVEKVVLDASKSTGSNLNYRWTTMWGTQEINLYTGSQAVVEVELAVGSYEILLKVTDGANAPSEDKTLVEVKAYPGVIVMDNKAPGEASDALTGPGVAWTDSWTVSAGPGSYGFDSLFHVGDDAGIFYRFAPEIIISGDYQVTLRYTYHSNRAENSPILVSSTDGIQMFEINECDEANAGKWVDLGMFHFVQGAEGYLSIATEGTENHSVSADGVRFWLKSCVSDGNCGEDGSTSAEDGTVSAEEELGLEPEMQQTDGSTSQDDVDDHLSGSCSCKGSGSSRGGLPQLWMLPALLILWTMRKRTRNRTM